MLIIDNKRNDYYDGVVGTTGVDKTIIYDRKFEEIENESLMPKEFIKTGFGDKNPIVNLDCFKMKKGVRYYQYNTFIVGFCGKFYIGWKLYYKTKPKNPLIESKTKIYLTYDFEIIKEQIKVSGWKLDLIANVNYVNSYDPINIFRKYNTPIFLFDNNSLTHDGPEYGRKCKLLINPILKDYCFYKVFGSFNAFQEIEMFISGVLGNKEKNIIEIKDKYKITQHGFDKFSFRKDKEIKK